MIGRMKDVRHLKTSQGEIYMGVVSLDDADINITYNCATRQAIVHEGYVLSQEESDAVYHYSIGYFEALCSLEPAS